MVKEYLKTLGITKDITEEKAMEILIEKHKNQLIEIGEYEELRLFLWRNILGKWLFISFLHRKWSWKDKITATLRIIIHEITGIYFIIENHSIRGIKTERKSR